MLYICIHTAIYISGLSLGVAIAGLRNENRRRFLSGVNQPGRRKDLARDKTKVRAEKVRPEKETVRDRYA